MSGGSWGGGGDKPVRLSAWCLERLGWVSPKTVRRAGIKSLQPLAQDKRDCYRLWSKGKKGPEYFLIENRQRAGRDVALPGSGLAVWHIDETQTGNTNPLCYMVGLVQADGKRDMELNRNDGDPGDLFPGAQSVTAWNDHTTPPAHANDGTPTGVALSQISEKDGVIRLRAKV
jgi:immune inhibitor A